MRTLPQLLAAGFTVQPATDAVSCTEFLSDKPFWYVNAGLLEQETPAAAMSAVNENLQAATPHEGKYRMLMAGTAEPIGNLPFFFFDAAIHKRLTGHFAERTHHANEIHRHTSESIRAAVNYMDLLVEDETCPF